VPWKECDQMDERLKFVVRLLDSEKMVVLRCQFGISRKTGRKILARYNKIGPEGLTDRSRRPYRCANRLPFTAEVQAARLYFSASASVSSRNAMTSWKNCMRFFSIMTVCVPSPSSTKRL
jgi:hypothetical protein